MTHYNHNQNLKICKINKYKQDKKVEYISQIQHIIATIILGGFLIIAAVIFFPLETAYANANNLAPNSSLVQIISSVISEHYIDSIISIEMICTIFVSIETILPIINLGTFIIALLGLIVTIQKLLYYKMR